MSDTAQIHEIYCMKDDELKKMVGLGDYLESLAEIHKLRKRVEELEAQVPKWVSVDDELPDEWSCVDVWVSDDFRITDVEYASQNGGFYVQDQGTDEIEHLEWDVVMWCKPQPPKENT